MTVGRRSLLILLPLAFALLAAACASKAGAPGPPTSLAVSATITGTPTTTTTSAPSGTDATPAPSAVTGDSITIDAVGDISLARQIVDRMNENGPDYPYALIAPLIDADIGFANLEGALT